MIVWIAKTVARDCVKIDSITGNQKVKATFSFAEILAYADKVIEIIHRILVENAIELFRNGIG